MEPLKDQPMRGGYVSRTTTLAGSRRKTGRINRNRE